MKQENGYWIDENNNKWSVEKFSEEEAIKASKSLKYCTDCVNCEYCKYCTDCKECFNCNYCTDCKDCIDCNYCTEIVKVMGNG